MKIVIVGDGKVGYALAEQLSREKHDIVIIDNNAEALQFALDTLDVMAVYGNGASLDAQNEADVAGSDLLIAATSSDEINLLCCILAKKLGCRHTISRVRNPEYSQQIVFLRDELGLSMTLNPELAAAREIYRIIQFPSFLKRDSFAKGRVELVELMLSPDSFLCEKRLDQLYTLLNIKLLVCAVERDGALTIPNGSFVLKAGDKINVTAPFADLAKLIKDLHISTGKIHNVMIIGGGRISAYLSDELLKSGINVKIIEKDPKTCLDLAEKIPKAIVINGDGSRQNLLMEEGLAQTDAAITLTDIDEENLIVSMFASSVGVPKTITKINRIEYTNLFADKGIGSIISPKQLTTNGILRYVRAMCNTTGGSVKALHKIVDGKAEALEFDVLPTTMNKNIPLFKLRLKPDILIACINHKGTIIIPRGSDSFEEGDTVIIVTTENRTIYDLNDIFKENISLEK